MDDREAEVNLPHGCLMMGIYLIAKKGEKNSNFLNMLDLKCLHNLSPYLKLLELISGNVILVSIF